MKILKHRIILKKEFLASLQQGQEIIDQAEHISSEIIQEAKNEAKKIKSDAFREGFEAGKAEGISLLIKAIKKRDGMIQELEEEIIDLAINIASKIIDECRNLNPDIVKGIFRKAISATGNMNDLILKVHPEDYNTANSLLTGNNETDKILKRVTIVKDKNINRGGCIVETETGIIDASIETQLEILRKFLNPVKNSKGKR